MTNQLERQRRDKRSNWIAGLDEFARTALTRCELKSNNVAGIQVRDLCGVVTREKAAIGVPISMNPPTKPMRTEAATAGHYESKLWNKKYPKIQLLTVAELLAGKQIEMPPVRQVGATFKKAPKASKKGAETGEFSFEGDGA